MLNKKRIVNIVGACLFVLFLVLILPGTATAAKTVENTYAVVVTTGNDAGNNVSYFGLQYLDADGYSHFEYVFPHKDGLQDTYEMVPGSNYTEETALGRGKTNTFFFTPAYEVAEIVGLDIYCQGEQGSMYAWDVSGLRIYRVDEIIDVVSSGQNRTIRFNGSQLAYLEERSGNGGVTLSWTGNSVFQLREQGTSHRLIFETIPFSMEGDYEYAVRVDFADINGAGIEALNQAHNAMDPLATANFREYMAIEIEYLDIYGDARCVTLPVIKGAINYMLENGIPADTKMAGFAQQGESIVISSTLQDMLEVKAVMLYTGSEAESVLGQPVSRNESVNITGVSVYDASVVSASLPPMENYAGGPEYAFSAPPLYYHTATNVEGESVGVDNSHYVSMRPYANGAALAPSEDTEKYLVELIADSSQIISAPEDILLTFKYSDMSGATRISSNHSVREGVLEFYGYWPASVDDFSYIGQINSSNGVCFVVELPDVEHFTGLEVSIPLGGGDWQMAGVKVTRLDSLSKRYCVWEDIISNGAVSNRRYFRNAEGYLVFNMEETALIQPGNDYEIDFVSQSVQQVDAFDWNDFRYAMSYEQCSSNLGLAKARKNYTVEVQVQSGATSLLDGYGDNGSKNRFYFLLEFENGDSGYVLANQQLGADGFRSGCTESFIVSTNYDYGELVAVHVIPDDISEDSDPYDKLNIAQIRVRRNDDSSVSKEWIIQNVGWIGIDYQDEGASVSISGQKGRMEAEVARIYPVTISSYALNLEFRLGTGTYTESGSGGAFHGTMEGTLEYYNKDGKRNQLTFDVVRAMYDYANKTPIYMNDGTTGSTGTPLAVTDNSFMFRENHTDRFVISVSDVTSLGKLTLNMKSLNGGSLQITNVTAALVLEKGTLQINEQDEYMRTGKTEYLCEDTVDKIPAFEMFLPTDRNIYQDIYFTEHEAIKLDAEDSTWISTISRVPNSQNDTLNVFVYPADDASGIFDIDVRAQYTDTNGTILETGARSLDRGTDAEGNTVYSVFGLTATSMSALNRVYVKAQSPEVISAYIDHMVVQQVRSGVVINTFYLNCEHRNAEMEFYVLPSNILKVTSGEQKVYLAFGDETESANLLPENRDIAVALRYRTVNGGEQEYTSSYIYITDQQYQSIKAGDIVELTFKESYLQDITGIIVATNGNVKAQVDMASIDSYSVDETAGTRRLLKHISVPTGATIQNQAVTLRPSTEETVELLDVQFVTAQADAYLESGTSSPIAMVVGYTDHQGVQKTTVIRDIREYVTTTDADAFSTGSTTQIRLMLRDVAAVNYLQVMPYDLDPAVMAGWKPSQVTVSVGTDGSIQRINRSITDYVSEDKELDPDKTITADMIGGLKINLVNIIVSADVATSNSSGYYGNSRRITSAGEKTLKLTVLPGTSIRVNVTVSNSEQGYAVKAVQTDGLRDISGLVVKNKEIFTLSLPENATEQDETYRITINSKENDKVTVVIEMTVKGTDKKDETTAPTTPPSQNQNPTTPPATNPGDETDPPVEDPPETTVPPVDETEPPTEEPPDETEPPTEEPPDETEPPTEEPSDETEPPVDEPSDETEPPTEEPPEETVPPVDETEPSE